MNLHFIRPEYLYLLMLLPIIFLSKQAFRYLKNSIKKQKTTTSDNWIKVCSPEILDSLYLNNKNKGHHKTYFFLFCMTVITIFSLAGPTWSKHEIPLYKSKASWVITLSLAETMQNTDVTPTRLQRAKYKIQDFLNLLTDEQLAFIIYTQNAFNLIPLTSDKKTIDHILPSVDPLIMPVAGDNINSALEKILDLRKNLKIKDLNVLVLTDGNANSQSLLTAKKFSDININIINFNKTQSDGFNNSLAELSSLTNGLYQNVTNNDEDLKNILSFAKSSYKLKQSYEKDKDHLNTEVWHDMGPYLLFLLLPFILLFFSRSRSAINMITIGFCTALILGLPAHQAYAAGSLSKLLFNQQQLAAEQLKASEQQLKPINPEVFNSPTWQAAAYYKNKNYNKSAELLKNQTDVNSVYNYANSLAQQGNIPEAIENYKKVLQSNPNHQDAKFNLSLLEKYQQNQNNKNQNKQDQSKQDQNKKNQDQNQNKQDHNKNNQDQQDPSNDQNNPNSQKKDKENNQNSELNNNPDKQKPQKNQNNNQQNDKNNKKKSELNQKPDQQKTDQASDKKSDKELQQWLNKIPDNPAIYLRNQLQYEYWKEQQQ